MAGHAIQLEEVQEIIKDCNIEVKPGDIFFMRCGFQKTWESSNLDQKKEYRASTQAHKHKHTGLIQSEAVCKFMWDNHIVAVAGMQSIFWNMPLMYVALLTLPKVTV